MVGLDEMKNKETVWEIALSVENFIHLLKLCKKLNRKRVAEEIYSLL